MILATWQPLAENNNKENNWPELTGYLGYKPIFCFSAENEMSLTIGSAFSKPSRPERLIIFESYEYKKINKKFSARLKHTTAPTDNHFRQGSGRFRKINCTYVKLLLWNQIKSLCHNRFFTLSYHCVNGNESKQAKWSAKRSFLVTK